MESKHLGDDAFMEYQAGLTVSLISTPHDRLTVCRPDEPVNQARQRADDRRFDYLPVMDCSTGESRIVGLFSARRPTSNFPDGEVVSEEMVGLSDANLIGADASIGDFILGVESRPICLTVSGQRIDGLVSWTDLQKLPVRATLFGMITGLELSMSCAIECKFDGGDGWMRNLSSGAQSKIRERVKQSTVDDGEIDKLLHTQFHDKATIVRKSISLGQSSSKADQALKRIKELRDLVAHANNYAGSFANAKHLARTIRELIEIQKRLEDFQA